MLLLGFSDIFGNQFSYKEIDVSLGGILSEKGGIFYSVDKNGETNVTQGLITFTDPNSENVVLGYTLPSNLLLSVISAGEYTIPDGSVVYIIKERSYGISNQQVDFLFFDDNIASVLIHRTNCLKFLHVSGSTQHIALEKFCRLTQYPQPGNFAPLTLFFEVL